MGKSELSVGAQQEQQGHSKCPCENCIHEGGFEPSRGGTREVSCLNLGFVIDVPKGRCLNFVQRKPLRLPLLADAA